MLEVTPEPKFKKTGSFYAALLEANNQEVQIFWDRPALLGGALKMRHHHQEESGQPASGQNSKEPPQWGILQAQLTLMTMPSDSKQTSLLRLSRVPTNHKTITKMYMSFKTVEVWEELVMQQ